MELIFEVLLPFIGRLLGYLFIELFLHGLLRLLPWFNLQHKRLDAPTFEDDATIPIRVQCRDSANGSLNNDIDIRFALVVSLEVESTAQYDVHQEISDKVRLRLQQNP